MPEWSFPVSLPRFADDEFKQKQQEYVAEHGYYVSAPRIGDIIHLSFNIEPDDAEWNRFRSGELARTDPRRFDQIVELLEKKRARRDRMLASPVPTKLRNLASVMTVFDDINDTLGTAGIIMRVAARLAPRALGRLMLGPIGWLFLAAEIAGLFLQVMRLPFSCLSRKRIHERVRDMNPFSKKARVRRARKMRRLSPSKGELIELLQTTDNLFGIGLCLGPIIGFGYDVISGTVRTVIGQDVSWGVPPPSRPKHTRPASRFIRNAAALHGLGDEMSDEDHLAYMIALNGATQLLKPYIDEWHPLDQVDNFNALLFEAPRPEHPTTKFILEEVGIHEGEGIGWPGLDKDLVNWEELWDHTQPIAAKRFTEFAVRNRNSYVGAVGAQNGDEYGMNMLLMLEGYDTVEYESEPIWKGYSDFYSNGCKLHRCGGFSAGRATYPFYKTHAIQMGDMYLIVTGASVPDGLHGRTWFGTFIHCKDCKILVGPQMCPAGFQLYPQSAHVEDETQWLERIRTKPTGLITTGPPRPT